MHALILAALALLAGAFAPGCGAAGGDDDDVIVDDGGNLIDARLRDASTSDRGIALDSGFSPLYCGLNFAERTVPTGHACTGATLELGTGDLVLEPFQAGSTIPMVMGPQGGLMLLLAFRSQGLDERDVTLCQRITFTQGGAEIGFDCWTGSLTELTSGGVSECRGLIAQTKPMYWGTPTDILDHDVTVDFSLTDQNGCQLRQTSAVHVSPTLGPCASCQ